MHSSHAMTLLQGVLETETITAVAVQIGYSRTAVSLYLSGKYGADVDKLEAAIVSRYDIYPCPHTGQQISGPECTRRATAPRPFGGRAKEAHWIACQSCVHHTQGEKK